MIDTWFRTADGLAGNHLLVFSKRNRKKFANDLILLRV